MISEQGSIIFWIFFAIWIFFIMFFGIFYSCLLLLLFTSHFSLLFSFFVRFCSFRNFLQLPQLCLHLKLLWFSSSEITFCSSQKGTSHFILRSFLISYSSPEEDPKNLLRRGDMLWLQTLSNLDHDRYEFLPDFCSWLDVVVFVHKSHQFCYLFGYGE